MKRLLPVLILMASAMQATAQSAPSASPSTGNPVSRGAAASPATVQDTLHLFALQAAAVRNDPRAGQVDLEETASALRLRNLSVERLPALHVAGEATRQSESATIPFAVLGVDLPEPPKDRYELAVNADWLLFDGGGLGARRSVERARLDAVEARIAAELEPLRGEVVEAFFSALLLQERIHEVAALERDLDARLKEVRAGVRAGAALPGDTAAVLAELLRAAQQREELAADRRAWLAVLEALTGREIAPTDVLALPDLSPDVAAQRSRLAEPSEASTESLFPVPRVHPRFALFDARRTQLEREATVVGSRSRPRLSAFGRFAYGRPGLAQFTDDPHDYWLAGLRVQWQPWDWGSTARNVEAVRIQSRIVDTEEAVFSRQLARRLQQPLEAMERLEAALETDARIVTLREQVERQARAQLSERAITAAAYVDTRTDLQQARQAALRHRVELELARARFLTILGVERP